MMWQAWTLQQETKRAASDIYEITGLVEEVSGLPSTIHAYMFDSAVVWFGRYIDNKLAILDKDGKPEYTLEQLLTRRNDLQAFIGMMRRMNAHVKVTTT